MQPLTEPPFHRHLVVTAHEHVETDRQEGACRIPRLFGDTTVLKHPGAHLLVISRVRAAGRHVVHERGERARSSAPGWLPLGRLLIHNRPYSPG